MSQKWRPFSLITSISLALTTTGCYTTATIRRGNGPTIESRIVDGDSAALFVQSDNGLVYRVDRRTVADVDHPGNIHLAFGGIALGIAASIFISSFGESDPTERGDLREFALGYAAVGLPLALWGAYVHTRSRWADEGREPRAVLVQAMPEDPPLWPPRAGVRPSAWAPPPARPTAPAPASPPESPMQPPAAPPATDVTSEAAPAAEP